MKTTAMRAAIAFALTMPLAAQAAYVDGDLLTLQGYSSTTGFVPYGTPVNYVGGTAAVAFPGGTTPFGLFSSSGDVVTLTFITGVSVPSCIGSCLEGASLAVAGQNVSSASIDLSQSSPVFSAADVGASNNVAFVQLQGLTLTAGDRLVFDVGASPVPLPPAAWLLGSGLLGLVGVRRRRAA